MSPRAFVSLAVLLSLFNPGHTFAQAPAASTPVVSLYLSSDTLGPVLKQTKANDPALAGATPVADSAKAAAGWQTASLNGPFPGYARSNTARKDLTLRPGTPVYLQASESSPVLGLAQLDPPTNVDNVRGSQWFQVTYPGPVVVYFQQAKAPAPAPAPVAVPAPVPVAQPVLPVIVSTAVSNANASSIPRYYVGVLKLRTNPLVGGPADAQYMLMGNNGQLLVLVDLGNVILPGPASDYLGQRVRIYGATEPASGSLVALLRAQLLQPN